MKLDLIKYDNANVLEATWYEETEEAKKQVHCQAYADVQMDMLRADAEKYGTSLDEYEELIAEVEANIILPSAEEIAKQELEAKIAEAKAYLQATDYVAVKYNDEVTVTGSMTKTAFLAQYADVYAQRAEARAVINMGETNGDSN